MSVTTRVSVPFRGEGEGAGEMTWGQREMWLTTMRTGNPMNTGGMMVLAEGTTVEDLAGVLRYTVERHQALRTRWHAVEGGLPRQVVSTSGETHLEIVDVDPDADPEAEAEILRDRYEVTPFDYAVQWPVRMGVVRHRGVLTHLVVMYCHLAIDGYGIDAAVRDLAHRDPTTGRASAPVAGLTPLELAERQHTASGRRQSDRSLRYWESQLRAIPARRFGTSTDPREPRFWELVCHSYAMRPALRRIAERTRADTGQVLLAAYAVALGRISGRSPSVVQVVVSNRFRPGCAESVSHLVQPGLCVIDVADTTFDDVVARASRSATSAYMHAYFDPVAFWDMVARVNRERGEEVEFSCFLNDRRGADDHPDTGDGHVPISRRWGRTSAGRPGILFAEVDSEPTGLRLSIWADTHRVALAELEEFAGEIEAVAVEAASDPGAGTGVAAASAPV